MYEIVFTSLYFIINYLFSPPFSYKKIACFRRRLLFIFQKFFIFLLQLSSTDLLTKGQFALLFYSVNKSSNVITFEKYRYIHCKIIRMSLLMCYESKSSVIFLLIIFPIDAAKCDNIPY